MEVGSGKFGASMNLQNRTLKNRKVKQILQVTVVLAIVEGSRK
jgi:hypothetical protein